MFCSKCGSSNPETGNFCSSCGTALFKATLAAVPSVLSAIVDPIKNETVKPSLNYQSEASPFSRLEVIGCIGFLISFCFLPWIYLGIFPVEGHRIPQAAEAVVKIAQGLNTMSNALSNTFGGKPNSPIEIPSVAHLYLIYLPALLAGVTIFLAFIKEKTKVMGICTGLSFFGLLVLAGTLHSGEKFPELCYGIFIAGIAAILCMIGTSESQPSSTTINYNKWVESNCPGPEDALGSISDTKPYAKDSTNELILIVAVAMLCVTVIWIMYK